jgi:hypothetical protein
MADFDITNGHLSDSNSRHEGGMVISLPSMSDTNSVKKKSKPLKPVNKKHKPTPSKKKLYVKRNNELVGIKEEPGIMETTQTLHRSSNIKVAVRLRPLHDKEIEEDQFEIVQVVENSVSL